jgi:predicted dehydrogenase
MIRIGLAGIGFMGMIHYLAARTLPSARVVAISSRDRKKLAGDWTGIRGNFGPTGTHMDLSGLKRHENFADLLADPDIDLVDICTPTRLHPGMAIDALRTGKHVLVEKAIALSTADADAMVAAARAAGRQLLVAHVLPFFPEFAFAADAVRSGKFGRLLGAHFKRVISRPDWSSDIADAAATGGPAVDLHIHDTHFIRLIAGMPIAVCSTGVEANGVVEFLTTAYLYGPNGPAISCTSGAVSQSGRPFAHSFEVFLERATLTYDSGGTPLTVFTADGKSSTPELASSDPIESFARKIQAAVDGITSGQEPALLSGACARDALVLCHKEIESVRSGKTVTVE